MGLSYPPGRLASGATSLFTSAVCCPDLPSGGLEQGMEFSGLTWPWVPSSLESLCVLGFS